MLKAVLDTHVFIWLMQGDTLSKDILEQINYYAHRNKLYIAEISFWEIAMLAHRKRINFNQDICSWLQNSLKVPGLQTIGISPQIANDSVCLPDFIHKDPADRIIIATSRFLKAKLFTKDQKILDYKYVECIAV